MIGRDLKALYLPPAASRPAAAGADIDGGGNRRHLPRSTAVEPRRIRRGEILGLAGLIGAGRTELARVIFGIDERFWRATSRSTAPRSRSRNRADAIARGIFLVPEDRKRSGLLLDLTRSAKTSSLPNLHGRYARRLASSRPPAEEREHGRAPEAAATWASGRRQHVRDVLHRHAVGRQPAEGGARQVAGDEAPRC